ncbi:MAG: type IX secretion system outer membrane channel protein PorV [Mucilaginibacter sp.]
MKFLPVKIALVSVFIFPVLAKAQNVAGSSSKAISTEVPFLNISPDPRSGAMGEAGVALSPDANATFWNPAKLAFLEDDNSISFSYSPWLRKLVPDVHLAYLSFAHKIDERNSFGASLRYFNLGAIALRDDFNTDNGSYTPNEFAIDGSFARKFGNNLSLGLTLRYIRSNLSSVLFGTTQSAGNAVAADVSLFYRNPTQQFGKDAIFAFGVNISNIGTKIGYSDNGPKYFLPANLKIGAANTWYIDGTNTFTVTLDLNKLLVPTTLTNPDGTRDYGEDISVPSGIFKSFGDAPGGFSEELKEIMWSPGVEYWYDQKFALRAGYFFDSAEKGDRKYLSLGFGFNHNDYKFDFSYLVANQQSSPFANIVRFGLSANLGHKVK